YLGRGRWPAAGGSPWGRRSVTADQAAGLQRDLQATSYLPVAGTVSSRLAKDTGQQASPFVVTLSSGLTVILPSFVATDDAVQRALSLLFVSLAVIAAVVVLLGARLLTPHPGRGFPLVRRPGAPPRQAAPAALR